MIKISRMADPISGRMSFIRIKSESQMESLKGLFYQNHFPYEETPKGEIYVRANQFERLTQLLVGIEYELRSKHLQKRREGFKLPQPLPLKSDRRKRIKIPRKTQTAT